MGAAQEKGLKEDKPAPGKKETPKEVEEAKKLLDELSKPSKGSELIERLKKEEEKKKKEKKDKDYASIVKDGVEIVDGKVVPKEKIKLDKFGIPIPKNRKTWDKI